MNSVLKKILKEAVATESESGIIDIQYNQDTIDSFYAGLESCLVLDGLKHFEDPIVAYRHDLESNGGKVQYVLRFLKTYSLNDNDTELANMLAPYHITRICEFGLYADEPMSRDELYKEIEEYFKYGNNEHSKDLDLQLYKKDDHEHELLHTLSKL